MDIKGQFLVWCLLSIAVLMMTACERPPVETIQTGYRGTGMVEVNNPRDPAPEAEYPAATPLPPDGPAATNYQNVQVLGDLSVAQFTRLMAAITAWVSPQQGCAYCHNLANLASDELYTKIVSRRMIQMTQAINGDWQNHVQGAGVNCYTCHRGNNVPEYIWFADGGKGRNRFMGNLDGQNQPDVAVGYSSLPKDPFSAHLTNTDISQSKVRVVATGAFPDPAGGASIRDTESTYGLMMHFSGALGVNCAYCHNGSSFQTWVNSTPQRTTAYHGLQMVRDLNENYLIPLRDVYPDKRLGPTGDAPKAYCTTCHQGQYKPLLGADAISAYPSLSSN